MIKKYIEFAVNNWFELKKEWSMETRIQPEEWLYKVNLLKSNLLSYNVIELITKKAFIESITSWLWERKTYFNPDSDSFYIQIPWICSEILWEKQILFSNFNTVEEINKLWLREVVKIITTRQAIAISENELEKFIESLKIK